MPDKKVFALRLDPEVMKAVERWAADEFRSTNGQLEWIIAQALRGAGRTKGGPGVKTGKGKGNKS
jgi:hypothetical protein